jgi:hypothetical protein
MMLAYMCAVVETSNPYDHLLLVNSRYQTAAPPASAPALRSRKRMLYVVMPMTD